MNNFKAEPVELRDAMLKAVGRVLDSGWYVLGSEVESFEAEWAQTCQVAHGIGVGNGMDAIEIALRSLDIGPGDEVITTPVTAFATVLGILRAGATPVLADIEPGTGLLSIESVSRCISRKTKALVLVHLYGQVRGMDAWTDFCSLHGIALVEDCAQAHLSTWKGRVAGSFGTAGAFSFYPTKNLGAIGDAGMLITRDEGIAERARRLRNYGQSERYHHPEKGLNSRLDEVQAAMLRERLKWLPQFNQNRANISQAYRTGISNPRILALEAPEEEAAHVYHLYVVQCMERSGLQAHLHEQGVQSLIHYPIPIHLQEACRGLKTDPMGLRNSEAFSSTCLSLPCHPYMTKDEIDKVIIAANSFKGK